MHGRDGRFLIILTFVNVIFYKMKEALTWLILLTVVSMALTSCKGDDPQTDYASIIAGTYTGTVTTDTGVIAGITTITKKSETKVDMAITAGSHSLNIPGIRVVSTEDNVYTLSFSVAGNSLAGEVEGNNLTYTLSSGALDGTFTGTR
jgi:hypothetical protein